jgi:hypothetical protein
METVMEITMLKDCWELQGVVLETRIITAKKQNSEWRCYVIRVAGLGKQFEIQSQDIKFYNAVGRGQVIMAKGDFEFYNNIPKLMVRELTDVQSNKVVAK